MQTYLVFDTETSNLHNKNLAPQDVNQGRLMQFACVLLDKNLEEVSHCLLYSSDNSYNISPHAFAVHGITKEQCEAYGISARHIVNIFDSYCSIASVLVGFNREFDEAIMHTESILFGRAPVFPAERICLMKLMTDICKIPHPKRQGQFKWPKLEEAYKFAFNEDMPNAHNALGDVRATCKLLRWCVEQKHVVLA